MPRRVVAARVRFMRYPAASGIAGAPSAPAPATPVPTPPDAAPPDGAAVLPGGAWLALPDNSDFAPA